MAAGAAYRKEGFHSYGEGLYLRVSPKGRRTWIFRDRSNGDHQRAVGTYPAMSEDQARAVTKSRQISKYAVTTEQAIKAYLHKIKVVRPEQVRWLLKDFPEIHTDRVGLVQVLQKKAHDAPVMANRMLSRWKDFLNFCLQNGWVSENVLSPVQRRFIGGKENGRNRVLDWEEIAEITDPILRIILVTGLRPSEALYVARTKSSINIPNKRTPRDGYLHTLPNSHLLSCLLSVDMEIPKSHLTLSNRLRRAAETYRPHDLRRTFATRLSDLGVMPHIVEKMLGHKMTGVMAVYNHAEYWDERNAAQEMWDRKLIEIAKIQG